MERGCRQCATTSDRENRTWAAVGNWSSRAPFGTRQRSARHAPAWHARILRIYKRPRWQWCCRQPGAWPQLFVPAVGRTCTQAHYLPPGWGWLTVRARGQEEGGQGSHPTPPGRMVAQRSHGTHARACAVTLTSIFARCAGKLRAEHFPAATLLWMAGLHPHARTGNLGRGCR